MDDFARLFRLEGIGQVLVTMEAPNDEDDCADDCTVLRFRIPDRQGAELRMGMSLSTEEAALAVFNNLSDDTLAKTIKPLVSVASSLLTDPA